MAPPPTAEAPSTACPSSESISEESRCWGSFGAKPLASAEPPIAAPALRSVCRQLREVDHPPQHSAHSRTESILTARDGDDEAQWEGEALYQTHSKTNI